MARPFGAGEAKALLQEYLKLSQSMDSISSAEAKQNGAVCTAAEALARRKVAELLKDIPVEELNRDKRGIRVKLLRDRGYKSIADVLRATPARLEAIDGIGSESARTVRKIAQGIEKEALDGVKLRLSADDRSTEATNLIAALCKYKKGSNSFETCRAAREAIGQDGADAYIHLKAAGGSVKWLFANAQKRAQAERAYQYFTDLLDSELAKQVADADKQLRRIGLLQSSAAWKDFQATPIVYVTLLEHLVPQYAGSDDDVYGLPEELAQTVAEQELNLTGLRCTLRKYQTWGVKYILANQRVLLGDEMGLGKTVQAIAAMVSLRNEGCSRFLVVCPASVLSNWSREISKHSDINVFKIHGKDREQELAQWLSVGGAAVTTFETTSLLSEGDIGKVDLLVVDEAHYVKNPRAQRTQNVKDIASDCRRILFMTGTALENRVEEMISLIDMLNPAIANEAERIASLSSAPIFRQKIAPVYYRRKREDVLTELPELIESVEWCIPCAKEEEIYRGAIMSGNFPLARRVSWNVDDISQSCKAQRMLELIEEAEDDGRKVIVFSFFLDTISKVCALMGNRCMQPITGAVPPERRQQILDEFEKAPAGSVLAAQIISGGTGLNIQTASVVILCEPQFKPSTENQSISRAYRMGQTRSVLVYRLLCEDTVDERIMDILKEKQRQFDAFADESVAALESLELDQKGFAQIMESERLRLTEATPQQAAQP